MSSDYKDHKDAKPLTVLVSEGLQGDVVKDEPLNVIDDRTAAQKREANTAWKYYSNQPFRMFADKILEYARTLGYSDDELEQVFEAAREKRKRDSENFQTFKREWGADAVIGVDEGKGPDESVEVRLYPHSWSRSEHHQGWECNRCGEFFSEFDASANGMRPEFGCKDH